MRKTGNNSVQKRFTQPQDWHWGTITNADQIDLRYGVLARHQNPVANIVIAPGLSEFGEKYFELARFLSRLNCNVHVLHWRGQGGSPSYLSDPFRRHSLGFDRDARDLLQFTHEKVSGPAPKILLGHSMGGMISLLTLRHAPGVFKGAVLSAPLLGFQQKLGRGLESILATLPLPKSWLERYIPGGGPWMKRSDPASPAKPNAFTSDPVRMHLHDYWMENKPSLRVGNPTLGFVQEASKSILQLRSPGALESITTPTLFFSGGDDRVVSSQQIFNHVARLPNACHIHIPAAKHEILMEEDSIRRPVFKAIHNFIMANCP